ncbi:MAG: TIGR04282 family arsenosugar biosynthesis glycosyltransferase [Nitrospirota bacterium]|nr:TIGR04282 family arsenosugar biosynthesis glycosyltransferase [Nitrospirota bacterium]
MGDQLNTKNSTLKMNFVLVIFGKAPIPGQVKTRLCPPLTPDEAATLQGSLVLDVVERARASAKSAQYDCCFACSPSREHVFFKVLEDRQGLRLLDQVGDNLGARMHQAFQELFDRGYRQVVIVGTDVPTLPGSTFAAAFRALKDHDLVLGPALDGGYYLIGLKRPAPDLFAGIPWSTDQVAALTRKKAEGLGLKTALLPPYRDLDRLEDLQALIGDAKTTPKAFSLRTAGVLQTLAERLKSRDATLD